MRTTLLNYEWQFLLQLVTRIHYCKTYEETCDLINQQLPTLIPCYEVAFFRINKEKGQTNISNMLFYDKNREPFHFPAFTSDAYPNWAEYIMSPHSNIFRQSDLISQKKWESSRVYNEIWKKQNIYWGLMMSLVYHDHPLVLIGLFREKESNDFSDRDIFILRQLTSALEMKFNNLLENNISVPQEKILSHAILKYNLTKREAEIVSLLYEGTSNEDICAKLFITKATLNKHIANIYAKTQVKNRVQLIKLFS